MWLALLAAAPLPTPRSVRVSGKGFVLASTGEPIVLAGPNVVVKGPPYLPAVTGSTHCHDVTDSACSAAGNCTTCYTFNEADVALLKSQKRNFIRLGVVWAGAQPRDTDGLDPSFLERLHAILNLTDREGIHVMLDNHGDMTASAACGNGAPMWIAQLAAPELIGKPLTTGFPFSLIPSLNIENEAGFEHCGTDTAKWAAQAGDPNYNLLNECCLAINSNNPGGTGYTTIAQKNMDYMINAGRGRDAFVRFWRLMAQAVAPHPSAFALEPMNEPMSINRRDMYETWRAVTEAATAVIPDISVAVCDTGEGPVLPGWVTTLADLVPLPYLTPRAETVQWMKASSNLFYAWHYYGSPDALPDAVKNAQGVMRDWRMPSFLTEFMDCAAWDAAANASISHSYWHYSCYCDTGPAFGNKQVPSETFGGCILGWGSGSTDRCL